MTDQNTFTNDNGDQGTTEPSFSNTTDNGGTGEQDSGSNLQQQMEVMQKRIGDKDDFIGTLKDENQTLREKMADIEAKIQAMGSVEEKLNAMEAAKNSNQDTTLDEETLVSKVLNKMEAKTVEEKQDANFKEVSATLTKTYGADQVDSIVEKAAQENQLDFDDIIKLAKKSPQAVYKMLGVKTAYTPSPSPTTNSGFQDPVNNKEQKLAYFSKLRRENPKEFYKAETQRQFRLACLSTS